MSYLLICLLATRVFVCEKTMLPLAILFDICFCLCFLLHVFFEKNKSFNREIFFYLFGFAGVLFWGSFYSVNVYTSRNEALKFLICAFIFALVFIQSKKKKEVLVQVLLSISLLISLRAVYQYLSGLAYIDSNYTFGQISKQGFYAAEMLKQKRVVSWFFSPGVLAGYLIMIIPAVGGCIVKSNYQRQAKPLFFYLCLFLLAVWALLLTGSLAALLGLGTAVFCGGIIGLRIKNQAFTFKKLLMVGGLFFLCISVIFANRVRSATMEDDPANSLTQRIHYWQAAKKIIKQYPVTGAGLGNFGIVYPRFKSAKANETIYAHNLFLQFLSEAGIFGFLFFLFFAAHVYRRFSAKQKDPVRIGLMVGSCAFLIYNLADYSFFIMQNGYVWWAITACITDPEHDLTKHAKRRSFTEDFYVRLAFILICVFAVTSLSLEYKSQKCLEQGFTLLQQNKTDAAIAKAGMASEYRPDNDLIYYLLAHCYNQRSRDIFSPVVVDYYQKAIKLNPCYSFYYFYLGNYYFSHKLYEKAGKSYHQALQLYPTNQKFLKAVESAENPPR